MSERHAVGPKPFGGYWISAIDILAREGLAVQLHSWPGFGPCDDADERASVTVAEIVERLAAERRSRYLAWAGRVWLPPEWAGGTGYLTFAPAKTIGTTWLQRMRARFARENAGRLEANDV